ncbi:DUF2946 family protein [Luteimonas aquatica]|uniref:DUF2946 family protein n=1 Tax=Luteimonas aquatica TaxID=450364 RepID=UPI001F582C01|nr:DUF2946 family protein [Luteimonas aquatica]
MLRLALLAMLLLALLPTAGRLLQPMTARVPTTLAAICTTAGLKYVDLALFGASRTAQGEPDRSSHGHDGFDCDYCPLLATLTVAVLWLALLSPRLPARAIPPGRHAAPAQRFLPYGLGSRGPPLVL